MFAYLKSKRRKQNTCTPHIIIIINSQCTAYKNNIPFVFTGLICSKWSLRNSFTREYNSMPTNCAPPEHGEGEGKAERVLDVQA